MGIGRLQTKWLRFFVLALFACDRGVQFYLPLLRFSATLSFTAVSCFMFQHLELISMFQSLFMEEVFRRFEDVFLRKFSCLLLFRATRESTFVAADSWDLVLKKSVFTNQPRQKNAGYISGKSKYFALTAQNANKLSVFIRIWGFFVYCDAPVFKHRMISSCFKKWFSKSCFLQTAPDRKALGTPIERMIRCLLSSGSLFELPTVLLFEYF